MFLACTPNEFGTWFSVLKWLYNPSSIVQSSLGPEMYWTCTWFCSYTLAILVWVLCDIMYDGCRAQWWYSSKSVGCDNLYPKDLIPKIWLICSHSQSIIFFTFHYIQFCVHYMGSGSTITNLSFKIFQQGFLYTRQMLALLSFTIEQVLKSCHIVYIMLLWC